MSERKEDEEMVEHSHGSTTESSESEHMVDAEVELEESPQTEEERETPSGNSDSPLSDEGDEKNVESAEEPQLNGNGDVSSPTKPTFYGCYEIKDDEGEPSVMQPEVVAAVSEGVSNPKEGDENVEDLKKMEEQKYVDELKNVEESKDAVELRDAEAVKNEANGVPAIPVPEENGTKEENIVKQETMLPYPVTEMSFPNILHMSEGDDGTEEEQAAFVKELEIFFRERSTEFKHPKFYGEGLNCLKLWRAVTKLGGYDRVTACKLWRQVGESFHPPKTCTTVSWSFRIFYEKALLDYERHKMRGGELLIPPSPLPEPSNDNGGYQGSGRARRDAAARAMQGWHSQRLLGNGEVGDPIIKDKSSLSTPKREKHLKSVGLLKRKKPSILDRSVKAARTATKVIKPQIDTDVADVGTPAADWVKINVLRTKDCFEVYALVPGLLREEVRVQSDPAGRLVISGEPEQPDNPWGVTPFKKVITLPSRIDPHQTSAVVTLHGQLFVRVPFEQSDL